MPIANGCKDRLGALLVSGGELSLEFGDLVRDLALVPVQSFNGPILIKTSPLTRAARDDYAGRRGPCGCHPTATKDAEELTRGMILANGVLVRSSLWFEKRGGSNDPGRRQQSDVGRCRACPGCLVPESTRVTVRPLHCRAALLGAVSASRCPECATQRGSGNGAVRNASEEQYFPPELRLVVGLVAFLAALLGALQTFLGLAERADKHRSTASNYGAIRREIEQHQALPPASRDALQSIMATLRKRLDDTASSAPDAPESIRKKSGSRRDGPHPREAHDVAALRRRAVSIEVTFVASADSCSAIMRSLDWVLCW